MKYYIETPSSTPNICVKYIFLVLGDSTFVPRTPSCLFPSPYSLSIGAAISRSGFRGLAFLRSRSAPPFIARMLLSHTPQSTFVKDIYVCRLDACHLVSSSICQSRSHIFPL